MKLLNDLLDNYEFCLAPYIDAQSEFIDEGVWFRIEFKRKLRMINLDICTRLFHKNFIAVTENHYGNLLESFGTFVRKEYAYKNNPLVIDATQKVKFYLRNKQKDPDVDILLIEEFPGQGDLAKSLFATHSHFKNKEVIDAVNEQKHFYIFVTGLKQPDLPSDFRFLMMEVENGKNISLASILKSVDKVELGLTAEDKHKSKLAREIAKVREMSKTPHFGFKEALAYREFLMRLYVGVSPYSV